MTLRTLRHIAAVCLLLFAALAADVPRVHATGARAGSAPVVPDTPAGRQLASWLAAVNSGNRETIRKYVAEQYAPPPNGALPVERITARNLDLYETTGGVTLLRATSPSPTTVTAFLEARRTGYCLAFTLFVSADSPHLIVGSGLRATETPPDLLPRRKLSEREVGRRLDVLLEDLAHRDDFSGVVLVAKEGRSFYQRGFGLANRAWNAPNGPHTRFNLASITKMFTAVAVAQLVERGSLSYTDTVGKVLPDYPNKDVAQKVTVHHLLTHTSGIVDAPEALDRALRSTRPRTISELLAPFSGDPPRSEPGTRLQYSNVGYLLLGAIIERVSGQDYFTYVREHVFKPAGMADADFYELDSDPPNVATGYMDAPAGRRRSNIFLLPVRGVPFSSAYSTAADLVRFGEALRGHKLLGAVALNTLWSGKVDYTEPGSRYGYGCIVKEYNGTRVVGHGGGWFGITNKYDLYPDAGYTVVILTNIDSTPNPIAFKLREWLTQGRH